MAIASATVRAVPQPSYPSREPVARHVKENLCNFDHVKKVAASISLRRS
jgi:hypothetical protein